MEEIQEFFNNCCRICLWFRNTALRIRQGASTSSAILGNIYEGDSVNIIGEEGNWYKILYNNSTAYVSKDYITLNESSAGAGSDNNASVRSGYVINVEGSNLRVRQSASSSAMVLGYLVNNEAVEIVGEEGSWYKINYKNSTGYVLQITYKLEQEEFPMETYQEEYISFRSYFKFRSL